MNRKFDGYFVDFDGTLRDKPYKKKSWFGVSEKNKSALFAHSKKVPIIISTGRCDLYVGKLLKEYKSKYAICQNGAKIVNNKGEIVYEIPLDNKVAVSIIKFAYEQKMSIKINGDGCFYNPNILSRIIAITLHLNTFSYGKIDTKRKFYKISIFGKSKRKIQKIAKKLNKKNYPISAVTTVKGYVIEITNEKATKGKAALWVCDKLKINPKKCVHIGDTMNDVSGFMELGYGIAMQNSYKEVKSHADFIAPHYKKARFHDIFNGIAIRKNIYKTHKKK